MGTQHLEDFGRRNGLHAVRLEADLAITLPEPVPTSFDHASHYFLTFHDGHQGYHVRDDGIPETRHIPGHQEQSFEQFAQRWLYFELIRAVLRKNPGEFVKTDANGKTRWVDSSSLKDYSEEWYNREITSEVGRVGRLIRVQQVLDTARHFVSNYCTVSEPGTNPVWAQINRTILLSFMILGQTLSRVFIRILEHENVKLKIDGWTGSEYNRHGWGYTSNLFDALSRDGWCKKTVFMLQGLMRKNTLGLMNALEMEKPHPHPGAHDHCSITECKVETDRKHELYHLCDETQRVACTPIGRETHELNTMIMVEGKVPLLRYRKDSSSLDLVPMDPSSPEPYVVFSHIFSDGFGNPKENKINKCVLDYFADLFVKLGCPNICFWIDTITVPILLEDESNRKAIRAAIDSFQRIYAHALHTVVLDRSLMKVTASPGYISRAMTITVSQWMTRLWTLQEAIFSKSIQFAFDNLELVSIEELEGTFTEDNRALHDGRAEASRAYFHGILGNERQNIIKREFAIRHELIKHPRFVGQVWKASQWRTVKFGQHEMLALALLFQIEDMREFADTSNTTNQASCTPQKIEELMQYILMDLDRHSAIPAGMIFLPGQRLSAKGFGWAPVSWLSMREIDVPDPFQIQAPKAKWSPHNGLVVNFPGIRLLEVNPRDGVNNPLGTEGKFHFSTNRHRLEWYNVKEVTDDVLPDASKLEDMELALILPRYPLEAPQEIALLVSIFRTLHETHYVWIQCRVWISRQNSEREIKKWQKEFDKGVAPNLLCGQVLREQQSWCVDSKERPIQQEPVAPAPPRSPPSAPPPSLQEPPPKKSLRSKTWDKFKAKKKAKKEEAKRAATFQARPSDKDCPRQPTV